MGVSGAIFWFVAAAYLFTGDEAPRVVVNVWRNGQEQALLLLMCSTEVASYLSCVYDDELGARHGCCSETSAEFFLFVEEGARNIKCYCFASPEVATAKMEEWKLWSRILYKKDRKLIVQMEALVPNPMATLSIKRCVASQLTGSLGDAVRARTAEDDNGERVRTPMQGGYQFGDISRLAMHDLTSGAKAVKAGLKLANETLKAGIKERINGEGLDAEGNVVAVQAAVRLAGAARED
jgi:hypothetical protein